VEVGKAIADRFELLVSVAANQTFIDKSIKSYQHIHSAIMSEATLSGSIDSQRLWKEALRIESENPRTAASPTLPIAPVSSLFALQLRHRGDQGLTNGYTISEMLDLTRNGVTDPSASSYYKIRIAWK
jgi:hypothetical protein